MTREELILEIEETTGARLEPGLLGDIVDMLTRQGFLFQINEEYQQFPVSSKHAKKLARICDHPDCLKRPRTHGLCQTHYLQARRKGLIGEPSKCTVEGCEKPVEARGMCFTHYRSATRRRMDQ